MGPQSRALLLRAVTQLTCTYPGFMDDEVMARRPEDELLSVVLDAQRPGSVVYSLRAMLSAVNQVKDYMSGDTQRILNDLSDGMGSLPAKLRGGFNATPEEELGKLVTALLALSGLAKESMVRGQGWLFMDMGRRIERALQTISLVRALWVPLAPEEADTIVMEAALLSTESLMTYRHRYQGASTMASGLDLLLLEAGNPRALVFQLDRLGEHLASLSPSDGARLTPEQSVLLEASSALRLADLPALAEAGEGSFLRGDLDQLLSRVHYLLGEIANLVNERYFDHTAGPQPMRPLDGEESP